MEEFDIPGLAEHLHLTAAQVLRLAERGQIPARRVGGEWRFHPAEVHQWWEQRIGLADDQQLAEMEVVLRGPRGSAPPAEFTLAALLRPEAIELQLDARTNTAVIGAMVEVAARTGLVWDQARLADAIRAREELHSTALDEGVALLHPRRPQPSILGDALIAFGRTPGAIPFGNTRGKLTDLFFMICTLDDRTHLRVLARLSRLLSDPAFLDQLRWAATVSELHVALAEAEQRVLETAAE